ncbi:hypothetical protein SNEBB_000759 [Seison nebaliae]|nr:hypothetical protein SNEBB_000759 [Seison nebaliae]
MFLKIFSILLIVALVGLSDCYKEQFTKPWINCNPHHINEWCINSDWLVCGNDHVTYLSECSLQKRRCEDPTVELKSVGACKKDIKECAAAGAKKIALQLSGIYPSLPKYCASNGKEYKHVDLKIKQCKDDPHIALDHKGGCDQKDEY